ncbi:MAG: DUF2254 domain-containing protein [Actinomycetota bacterium]|nr:DUF2254 domain-containing protein [Actinomycetota bacterium]
MKLSKVVRDLKSGLWFIPLLYAVGGLLINIVTVFIDHASDYKLVPIGWIGGPEAALAILGAVAASMISLVATVLAITMVVVQLAMAQFSPRIVQTFLQDRPSQNAIGLFVATFVQSMLSMREVQVSNDHPVAPGASVAVTFLLVVVDIVVLVIYVHHIGRALRVSALIELVGKSTRTLMDEAFPTRMQDEGPRDAYLVTARSSGVLSIIERADLVALASSHNARIDLVPPLGQYVPAGAPLARLTDVTIDEIDLDRLHKSLDLTLERTLEQDVSFGLRMLVDMGIKAIAESPLADPTTTVQAIDRIHDVLRQLARREFPEGAERDGDGVVRLVIPSMDWQAFVRLGFEELRLAGSASPQVARRLRAALDDLLEWAPKDRREPLQEQLDLLQDAIEQTVAAPHDRRLAHQPDSQGFGVAAGDNQPVPAHRP